MESLRTISKKVEGWSCCSLGCWFGCRSGCTDGVTETTVASSARRKVSCWHAREPTGVPCVVMIPGSDENMTLYVDKHRPSTLDRLDYHEDLTLQLKRLVSGVLSVDWFAGSDGIDGREERSEQREFCWGGLGGDCLA